MFTKFRLSVEEKQALNFGGILFFGEHFSGVQLGCWILKDFYGA